VIPWSQCRPALEHDDATPLAHALLSFECAPRGLDPVRLQKGMFLFGLEAAGVPDAQKYSFRPFHYGPMSKAITTISTVS
jgi:hypothetical protein